jgi:hypothetical protein
MDIDSFTLFTSSSNNLKLSVSPLSSINNINEELLKIHSKITQQQFAQQNGGNINSDSYKTSINKYNSVTDYSSDYDTSSSDQSITVTSRTKSNNNISNQNLSSTNNFESIYGSDSESLTDINQSTLENLSTTSSIHHNTNYLPKNSPFSSTSIPIIEKKTRKKK